MLIELKDVTKRFGEGAAEVTALSGVELLVDEGEFLVVLGPSGSGKTTLLNILGALDRATTGHVRVGGTELAGAARRELSEFRAHTVGFVFQAFNLFPGLTSRENVEFGVIASGSDADPDEVLTAVGLGDKGPRFPHELSGGEQQRVAIARALAAGNPILLCDEPTGELDFQTGIQILTLLRDQAGDGRSVVVVTHNREISRMADRVITLSGGRIVDDGPPEGGTVAPEDLRW
jgi:putative ABC transport system ATP-binding protein